MAVLGVENTSKVLAWVGSAMFGAFAAGAPIGSALYADYGFPGIALATMLIPIATLALVVPLRHVPSTAHVRTGLLKVMAAVWVPGVGSALSSVGFGAVTAFSPLLFVARGWPAWPAFSMFALAFIITRMFLGHLADRFGGAKVALVSVLVEGVGLGLIELAPGLALALTGAALTGLGYSLIYPGLGVEAVRRAPADSRGLAMGAYTAFLDVRSGSARRLSACSRTSPASAPSLRSARRLSSQSFYFRPQAQQPGRRMRRQVGRLQVHQQEPNMNLLATAALASLTLIGSSAIAEETKMGSKAQPSRADIRTVAPALEKYTQNRLLGDVSKRPSLSARESQRRDACCADCAQPDARNANLHRAGARQWGEAR